MWYQKSITLPEFSRGYHLITEIIRKNLPTLPQIGLLHIFIQHTSAALAINENADPSVRRDFRQFIDQLIPDGDKIFVHTLEGDDDMPAHIKSSLFGQSLVIPIVQGRLGLGTWQGIYLCEFRNFGGPRQLILTVWGE
ncbi:MAG: secondary thiamine-phosphate synthase enzyme YjbQ [Bacteroidales bacterium]|nr:secondary thiamine-phosphate synthase enzyme YjbQ [Bacteroidales bacterium]